MVATLRGTAGHDIITAALDALRHLEHRGAVGSDAGTGDGAGIITQMPDAFLRAVADVRAARRRRATPSATRSCPSTRPRAATSSAGSPQLAASEGLERPRLARGPRAPRRARHARPRRDAGRPAALRAVRRDDLASGGRLDGIALDRLTFRLRKRAERELELYFASLSSRTLVYKGMVTTLQLEPFYPDLSDERFASKLALVHSRYSTNTFPSWPLAQPFRMIAHNGEINTIQGNRNWMRARQSQLESELLGDLAPILPDRHARRERLRLVRRGRRAAHALRPQPAARRHDDGARGLGEPDRDRPRAPRLLRVPLDAHGAVGRPGRDRLHRRLARRRDARPQRPAPRALPRHRRRPRRARQRDRRARHRPEPTIVRKGRLRPGRMFLVDTEAGRLIEDDEIKAELAASEPWGDWLEAGRIKPRRAARARAHRAPAGIRRTVVSAPSATPRRRCKILLTPMAKTGAGAARRHGLRHPDRGALASVRGCSSTTSRSSSRRSRTRRSTRSARRSSPRSGRSLGPERNLLTAGPEHARQVVARLPGDRQRRAREDRAHRPARRRRARRKTLKGLYRVDDGPEAMRDAPRRDVRRGRRGHRRRRGVHRAQRPRLQQGPRADPVAAHALGGAPPPHPVGEPHEGRPRRRGRRRARGAPRRAPHRLRRLGGQPVPRDGDLRGPRALAASSRASRPRRPCTT